MTWYDPDRVVKFARGIGGGNDLKVFLSAVLVSGCGRAIADDIGSTYNEASDDVVAKVTGTLAEREALFGAIQDLDANVNPAFVCENTVREIRRIRKAAR